MIDEQLSTGAVEYPLYVKALIKRQQGEIQASLQLFQAATVLNPTNLTNLKQVSPPRTTHHPACACSHSTRSLRGMRAGRIAGGAPADGAVCGPAERCDACRWSTGKTLARMSGWRWVRESSERESGMQVGRSLYLLGKHKAANDVYEEAHRIGKPPRVLSLPQSHQRVVSNSSRWLHPPSSPRRSSPQASSRRL